MSALQERVLFEQLKEAFIIIQKSKQINKEMASWERRVAEMNEDEIEQSCMRVTRNISLFVENEKRKGRTLNDKQISNKVKEELNNL
jgi:hypothetical protein